LAQATIACKIIWKILNLSSISGILEIPLPSLGIAAVRYKTLKPRALFLSLEGKRRKNVKEELPA